jgi:predicted dehydrogenase
MNKIRVGVLGVGHLGKLHAKLYREVPQADIVGIYDTDLNKANEVAKEIGVQAFESRDALLKEVDAVNIVTPTSDHYETALAALENDCHLFIEKPIMAKETEAEDIIAKADASNKLLQVGHIERFNPAVLALSDVKLNPVFIESHRLASFNPRGTDVAVILDLMIHDLDLILSLVKSEPIQIDASGVGVISKNIDIANARIQFKNGCVANVTASRISTKKMRKMRIFQPSAYISLDFVEGFSEIYNISNSEQKNFKDGTLAFSLGQIDSIEGEKSIKYNKLQRTGVNPLKHELTSFVESISAKIPPIVSGQEGLAALKLANQVMQKIEEHTIQVKEGVISEV